MSLSTSSVHRRTLAHSFHFWHPSVSRMKTPTVCITPHSLHNAQTTHTLLLLGSPSTRSSDCLNPPPPHKKGKQVNTYFSQPPLKTNDTSPRRSDCQRLYHLPSVVLALPPFLPFYVSFHKTVKATRNQNSWRARISLSTYNTDKAFSFF